jgi:hypothetical protein
MKQLTNITSDALQRHALIIGEKTAILTLKFIESSQIWVFDIEYEGFTKYGFKLSLGVQHLNNYNWIFDFVILDTSNSGIDPFKLDDFESGRIELYMLEQNDLLELRGYDVQV